MEKTPLSKAERTRQFIIEKAAPIFNKKGYAGTSLSDIVQATGLTKGAIYGNFENKDEIALAVYDHNLGMVSNALRARLSAADTSVGRLMNMLGFYRTVYKTLADLGGCPILNAAVDADDTQLNLKERVSKSIRSWRQRIERVIEEGIEKKEIRTGVQPSRYSALFIAQIEGALMLSKCMNDLSYLNIAISHLETIINKELKR
jgi:TetR/AcrR family transcriptional repressor of nem operon